MKKSTTQDAVVHLTKALLSLLKHVEGLERRVADSERAEGREVPHERSEALEAAFDSVSKAIDALDQAG